ncbi:3871_t:CDS:1, partial [Acaulospora colombiana]
MMRTPTLQDHRSSPIRHSSQGVDADDVILEPIASWGELQSLGMGMFEDSPTPSVIATPLTTRRDLEEKEKEKDKSIHTNCPPMTGKIRNQLSARKSIQEALNDCGDDENLRACVRAATECEEYKVGKAVPAELLSALSEVV